MAHVWRRARKTAQIEVRDGISGEVLHNANGDLTVRPGDYVARDPDDHADEWVIKPVYFRANYEFADEDEGQVGEPTAAAV